MNKTLLTGIQPTGRVHIGNYVGSISKFIENQDKYDSFLFVADLHTLTSGKDVKDQLGALGKDLLLDYLALGVNPENVNLYFQSDVKEITEIFWILNNFIFVPTLSLGHSYKDAVAKGKEVTAGKLLYPVLMAADILSMDTDIVPVGKDQYQHIEVTREIAKRVNRIAEDDVLKVIETLKSDEPELLGVDGRKMSKSYNNTIPLFEGKETIERKVKSIVTDTTSKGEPLDYKNDITFSYHKIFSADMIDDIKKQYSDGSIGYKESKELLIENIMKSIEPMLERREKYAKNPQKLEKILTAGTEKARHRARQTLDRLRHFVGLTGSSIIDR